MIFHSIRWRLQLWHGMILVLVLAAFGYTAYKVAHTNQVRRIDQELEQRMNSMVFRPPRGPAPDEFRHGRPDWGDWIGRLKENIQQAGAYDSSQTNGYYYVLWQDGLLLASSPNAPADVPAPEGGPPPPGNPENKGGSEPGKGPPPDRREGFWPQPLRSRTGVKEISKCFPHRECVLVGHFMAPENAAMRLLALWLGAAGSGVLLLGLAGGWWLAGRAIRPIESISATAMKIAAGDLSQRIDVSHTDDELGRLATVLNSTFARLEAAFANQARFTADASHELRTPISVILSQTQTALSRPRSSPEYREALEACQRAASRMRNLAESLLALARLDAGQERFEHERFDLGQVTRESVELVRPLAAERGIQLECEAGPAACVGDPVRISQVATNLLTNAIHFNRDRGEVHIRAETENGSAVLVVRDTGVGIPAEDLPHVFERFYRVDKSRARIAGRTGLGLAIAKAIVDAHGGTIEVASEPGSGTTFKVKLPAN